MYQYEDIFPSELMPKATPFGAPAWGPWDDLQMRNESLAAARCPESGLRPCAKKGGHEYVLLQLVCSQIRSLDLPLTSSDQLTL